MIRRTIREYDIRHTGDDMDRLEILGALCALAKIVTDAGLAGVTIESVKSDVIAVKIEEIYEP
jgi:hypothetical protein